MIGVPSLVSLSWFVPCYLTLRGTTETMAAHRAQMLLNLLPNAMSTGYAEVEPELEPLKVINNVPIV
jgi:hypothetical protein